jgi:hypothetical protein
LFRDGSVALPWSAQLNENQRGDFSRSERRDRDGALWACGGRKADSPLRAGYGHHTEGLRAVFTLRGLAQRMEVSLSSFRPNPREGLAITLLERTGAVLLVF